MDSYKSIFNESNGQQIIGEASTTYIYSKVAAENIDQFNPNAKILAILREPVDLMYSWYFWEKYRSHETSDSFEAALDLEKERKKNKDLIPKNVDYPSSVYYREIADHLGNLIRYDERFPRENIKLILYEQFKENKESVYRDILKFLEVDDQFTPNWEIKNQTVEPRFPMLKKTIDPILDQIRMRFYNSRDKFPFKQLKNAYHMLLTTDAQRDQLDAEIKTKLKAEFASMVRELDQRFDLDCAKMWGYE